MSKRILKTKNEVFCGLSRDGLAIRLAGVAQYDPQDMCLPPLAIGADQRRASAEVNLGLLAGLALEATHRQLRVSAKAMDEAPDTEIAAVESVIGDQVLIDPLGRQTKLELLQDLISPGLAFAESPWLARGGLWSGVRRLGAEGRIGRSRVVLQGQRAEGRIGWF